MKSSKLADELAEKHAEDVGCMTTIQFNCLVRLLNEYGEAVRERLAQPEQESVAWTPQVWRQFRPDGTLEFQKIKRTPNGEWEDYTAPPRREWVGLTDAEIKEIIGPWGETPIKGYTRKLFDQIEAKLKEKNT